MSVIKSSKRKFPRYQDMSIREIVMGAILLAIAAVSYSVLPFLYIVDPRQFEQSIQFMEDYVPIVRVILVVVFVLLVIWLILFFLGKKKVFSVMGHFLLVPLFLNSVFHIVPMGSEIGPIWAFAVLALVLAYPIVAIVMAVLRRKKPEALLSLSDQKRKQIADKYRMLLEEGILTKAEYVELVGALREDK